MVNYSSCAVAIRSRYKQILKAVSSPSLYLYIFLYLIINRKINNNNYNIDQTGRIKLVLTYVSIYNVIFFSSVSISVFFKVTQLFVVAIVSVFSTANAINKSWLLHNLRLFSFFSMYETFSWKY